MNTEKGTNPNKTEPNPTKNPSLQFGISVSLGVLTILLLAASYYYGIIH
ncbi:hypothetical protein [Chroococcidiopsis sp. CCMEE 29]|jgi:hypothetical protein|nr:hypothetical protein [Chroococcidiopsis sp. CCMEE 29]